MIKTERFLLKPLTIGDATQIYLSWLNLDTSPYIESSKSHYSIETLKAYINERKNRQDVLFLGIFTEKKLHIGNIKYEPIDKKRKSAVMGILIGDTNWRGKGVAAEVIEASVAYLSEKYGVKTILLGVDENNKSAVKAYQKVGFKVKEHNESNIQMAWKL